jgi:hypothetical protein
VVSRTRREPVESEPSLPVAPLIARAPNLLRSTLDLPSSGLGQLGGATALSGTSPASLRVVGVPRAPARLIARESTTRAVTMEPKWRLVCSRFTTHTPHSSRHAN